MARSPRSRAPLVAEEGDGADRRTGATAPFERQADEAEAALAEQGLEIAKALDVCDAEFQACLVHERVDVTLRTRTHGIDAEMHNALLCQPFRCCDVDAGVVAGISGLGKGTGMMARAEQDGAARWDRDACRFDGRLQVARCDFRPGCDVPQVKADPWHDAVLKRILVDGYAGAAEVAGCVDVRSAMVGHGEIHDAVAVHVAGIGKGLLMRFPNAMDNGWLARVARRAMVELAAEVNDAHGGLHLAGAGR